MTTADRGRRRQRESTREALLEAGARSFSQHGFDGTRIASVAKDAGLANGTFYRYFEDKAALYREVVAWLVEDLAARVRRVHESSGHASDASRDRAEVAAFVDFVERYPGMIGAFWADGPNGEPLALLARQRERELDRMALEGEVRDDIALPVSARAEAYLLLATLCWWDETHEVDRETLISSLSALRRTGTRR
jgi:AcrR family transcriptional regulator